MGDLYQKIKGDIADVLGLLHTQPFYIVVLIVSSILVVFSIIYEGRYLSQSFSLLIIGIAGTLWRFFIIDLRTICGVGRDSWWNVPITLLWHIGNLLLFVTLVFLIV